MAPTAFVTTQVTMSTIVQAPYTIGAGTIFGRPTPAQLLNYDNDADEVWAGSEQAHWRVRYVAGVRQPLHESRGSSSVQPDCKHLLPSPPCLLA
eukprot:624136-Hanusia_phi.AAC.1